MFSWRRLAPLVIAGPVALPHPAAAQERHTLADFRAAERAVVAMVAGPTAPAVPQTRTRRIRDPWVWGFWGGVAGAAVGGTAGALSGSVNPGIIVDVPFLMGLAGMSLGIPLGVHLAYGADGPLVLTTLVSLGTAFTGWRTAVISGGSDVRVVGALATIPLVQLTASTYIEEHFWERARDESADPDADEDADSPTSAGGR